MKISLVRSDLAGYICKQLDYFFPDNISYDSIQFDKILDSALMRTECCFRNIKLPYFTKDGVAYFNHLHTDQYAMFLYLLSNTAWNEFENEILASKFMYLNKALHSVNCMYDTRLPEVFAFIHIVGTIIGKAHYGNYLTIYQGVTIGSHGGECPIIGDCVSLLPNSAVVGKCSIGSRVSVGLGTRLFRTDIPDDHIAVTDPQKGLLIIKSNTLYSREVFNL